MALAFYQQIYQIAPIILTGGAAAQIAGQMLPMLALTDPIAWEGVLGLGAGLQNLDDAFGAFSVLPGGSLIQQAIGKYPFANQSVAGNAVVREPLTISLIWDTPMRGPGAWAIKQSIMTALQATLAQHNNAGGTYTVVTPAFIYADLVMIDLVDSSRGGSSLPQNAWRFDFEKPLITLADAQGAQNQLTSKMTGGLPSDGSTSGVSNATGGPNTGGQPQLASDVSGSEFSGISGTPNTYGYGNIGVSSTPTAPSGGVGVYSGAENVSMWPPQNSVSIPGLS